MTTSPSFLPDAPARSGRVPDAVRHDRVAGVALGGAVGDALGAGYEFGPALSEGSEVLMKGGGLGPWAPGEWTDDTQMSVALLEVLAGGASGDAVVAGAEDAFLRWFAAGPADVGVQTRAVLTAGRPLARAARDWFERHPDRSAGNGSLMRTAPVALAHPGDPGAIAASARQVSALTHADPDALDTCVIWSVAIDHTVHHAPAPGTGWDWTAPLLAALEHVEPARRDLWAGRIAEAAAGRPGDFAHNGWVVDAFRAAVAALCSTPVPDGPAAGRHLVRALESAVRAGGDTDTVAAIAGSMLGARWGATAVPLRWRRLLRGHGPERRPELGAGDLEHLALLAHRGGRPDPQGWPGRPTMLDHYRPMAPSPLRVELGGVTFTNAVTIPGLLAEWGPAPSAGTDGAGEPPVVISLCRMGADDVRAGVEHHVLGVRDTCAADNPHLELVLADTVDTIAGLVADGRRVVVHCVAAQNRTPTVAAAWLHRHHGYDAEEALAVAAARINRPQGFLADAVRRLAAVPYDPAGGGG